MLNVMTATTLWETKNLEMSDFCPSGGHASHACKDLKSLTLFKYFLLPVNHNNPTIRGIEHTLFPLLSAQEGFLHDAMFMPMKKYSELP